MILKYKLCNIILIIIIIIIYDSYYLILIIDFLLFYTYLNWKIYKVYIENFICKEFLEF